jgi:hypothetical protein
VGRRRSEAGSLFRFPSNDARREEWIRAIREHYPWFTPKKSHKLCIRHFADGDYYVLERVRLLDHAVPSRFGPNCSLR